MKAPVILATDSHLFTAEIPTRGVRLVEVLNDHTTEFVVVNDFRLFSENEKERKESGRLTTAVRKGNLALAILPALHEASERRMYYFVAKKQYSCRAVVGDYLIEGSLYLRGAPDLTAILNTELQAFFPITDAVVSHADLATAIRPSVVLVNKVKLVALQIGEVVVNSERSLEPSLG